MNKAFVPVCMAFGLAACATTSIAPQMEVIDRPPLNAASKAELGDTIVEKGRVSTYDGLYLANDVVWGDGVLSDKFTIPAGKLRARQKDSNYTYYFSSNMTRYDFLAGLQPYQGGLCSKNSDPSSIGVFIVAGICDHKKNVNARHIRVADIDAPNFRQELIYNGRSGETVKFLYREFAGDYARPPFSQDVQYDLKDGNVIGFKGVRIEILEATNTNLNYRVLSSFPDPVQ